MSRLASSLVLIVFLSFAAASFTNAQTRPADVNAICKRAMNQTFCHNFLSNKSGVDLAKLAQFTLDVARTNITNTIKLLNSLISSTNNSDEKAYYQECLLHYRPEEGALGDLDYAQELLNKGDYFGMGTASDAVLNDIGDCTDGEDPDDPPYPGHSIILDQYANVTISILDISIVISNILIGRN